MKLYNTLTRKKEEFIPIKEGKVTMYVCGPTVYDYIHVGNARPLVVFDTLRRYFIYKGYNVKYVVNFTDIDDKIINRANKEGTSTREIADKYIEAFLEDAKGLNLYEENTIHPRATEFIDHIIKFIEGLIEKGAAYNVDGNVYFNINSAKDYGKLSKKNIDELISGARIAVNDEKRNPLDFVLWKKAKEGEPWWDSPWGKGRPGWHIECSVMAKVLLGDTIDIHAGGEDLQFPHHENEIAQSETLTGKPFANYWLHNGMLTIENQKMSKSLGNFFTVRDIKKEFDLEVLRFFLISAHYRNPINFSREVMEQLENALERLYNGKKNLEYLLEKGTDRELKEEDEVILKQINIYKANFIESMEDDLNTADAIASLFDIVKYSNTKFNERTPKHVIQYTYDTLMELSNVLGILSKEDEILEEDIIKLIEKRTQARKDKNYELADSIRDQLKKKGILLEDTPEGVKWKRI
ncbi:cysteinyl-tRNA synthetase [Keratinibaculum paraultunense]|uniref:Cysteine--tRNA ligase n=1 Tax=Keratinibaculum paraultunense TaxID=1278232 RepID=A0A4R3KSN8_9FIRM|nr:cysteine--tRNA ligase [Keratinibaculum paraultunense]QQY79435.1 cysteine--tRNA ligase [Keratinibaculum paraultunense]TCS88072.1 cysteinyl-tRNA synthetase [Keratinibaculum paraultunense]